MIVMLGLLFGVVSDFIYLVVVVVLVLCMVVLFYLVCLVDGLVNGM